MSLFGFGNKDKNSGIVINREQEETAWPRLEDGTPEKPAFLCHCKCNDLCDELKINMLQAYGIPTLTGYPGDGSFGRVVLGMSGEGADIYVPESKLNDAIELCKEVPQNELS